MSNTDVQDKPEDAVEQVQTVPGSERDDEDEEQVRLPLSPDEFRSVLEQIDRLGFTWTADALPLLRSKSPKAEEESFPAKEISEIQEKYPLFPDELGHVLFYALTGSNSSRVFLGSNEDAEQKAQIVRELIIDQRPDFSSEFFFKYAIKVPYFVDLDWEVVVKAFERNVRDMPHIPYALLSLIFRQSISHRFVIGGDLEANRSRIFTVAADKSLIEKLIASLTEARNALDQAGKLVITKPSTPTKEEEELK